MDLGIPGCSFSVSFLQILSMFMFIQDKEKEEQRIGYKEKENYLKIFAKVKILLLRLNTFGTWVLRFCVSNFSRNLMIKL